MIKVFLAGEGNNELGSRWHQPMGDEPGVVEVLLRRVRASGWRVDGAVAWKALRKYEAGAARGKASHADSKNVRKLVVQAYERACEVLAFVRDMDADEAREDGIDEALAAIADLARLGGYGYALGVIGGVARPSIEGWKSTQACVAVVEAAALPHGAGSLPAWLERAAAVLAQAIDGGPG